MRVYVQWARRDPEDWFGIEHTDLSALAKSGTPTAVHDSDEDGWIQSMNVQGVVFENWDHYGVKPVVVGIEPGLEIHVWNDDLDDHLSPKGQVWTFLDPAPDPSLGGLMNTRQTVKVYGDDEGEVAFWQGVSNVTCRPWSEFLTLDHGDVRNGVWTTDEAYARGQAIRSFHRWEEWVDGP